MATTIKFEHIAPFNGSAEIPDGYMGLHWSNFTAIGRGILESSVPLSGFTTLIHGRGVGAADDNEGVVDSRITAPAHTTFNVKGGLVACAWNSGETVTFHAIRHGHEIGTVAFVLDQDSQEFTLEGFKRLTELRITATGGADANGEDNGSGMHVALDDLKFVINTNSHPGVHHAHDFAPDFALPHLSDWPLA